MSPFIRSLAGSTPFLRTVAVAALMGTTMLASPLSSARAETPTNAPVQISQGKKSADAKAATDMKGETVEARITKLHADLKITRDEETSWTAFAQTMRDNAANMEKLVAEKRKQSPQTLTAVDDLNNYQDFSQAHLTGLKNLTSSFKTLYDTMSADQKKNADKVFVNYGGTPAKS